MATEVLILYHFASPVFSAVFTVIQSKEIAVSVYQTKRR